MEILDAVPLTNGIDREIARAYRRGHADNWMLNYFQYPENVETITYEAHLAMSEASLVILDVLRAAACQVVKDAWELQGRSVFSWLDIPNHCGYWIKKFFDPQADLFWGRPDFHIADGQPYLLESNLASAAGFQQQVGGLCQYYQEHPHLYEAFENHEFTLMNPMEPMQHLFARAVKPGETVLLPDIYEAYRHQDPDMRPYGGMVSWFNLNTAMQFRSEFIHRLDLRDDGVFLGDQRIDHIFMSYYNPHVFDRFDEFLPFWDLAERGHVNVLDSMNEILWSNKLLLAFLSEHIDELDIAADLRAKFQQTVPWTRIVRAGKTLFQGSKVDMERFIKKQKAKLVLKKAQSAEGKQVFVGQHVPQDAWDTTVDMALHTGQWIVQEFIRPDVSKMLVPNDDGFAEITAATTISPYLAGRTIAGYLTRYYHLGAEEDVSHSASVTRVNLVGTVAVKAPQLM